MSVMRIIKVAANENGSHDNLTGTYSHIPEGWAEVPKELVTENFPFGTIKTAEGQNGLIVTSWNPLPLPEAKEEPIVRSIQDDVDTMLVDHEYRLTLLELGVNE